MKPLFLFVISIICSAPSWGATIIHIPADVDSFAHAKQTCTASPTPGTVQYDSNQTDTIALDSNAVGIVQASSKYVTVTQPGLCVDVTSGCTVPVTFKNITFNATSTSACFRLSTLGVGFTCYVSNSNILNTGTASAVRMNAIPITASQFVFDGCYLYEGSNTSAQGAFSLNALAVTAHSMKVTNSILASAAGYGYNDGTSVSVNSVIDFDHCTFSGCVTAIVGKSGETFQNCLILNNTTDLNLTAPATITDFTNCYFGQQASGGNSCIYGATLANSFCDRANYWIGPQYAGLSAGVSTALVGTASYNGVLWPSNLISIGANAYTPALCAQYGQGK